MSNLNESMICFYIDSVNDFAGIEPFNNDLATMRRMIADDCVKITMRQIGGHRFRVISANKSIDTDKKVSALDSNGETMYEGNIIILGDRVTKSGRPGVRSLSEEEKEILLENLGLMLVSEGDRTENAYCMCNMEKV